MTRELLPWTEQQFKSALINLIEATKNSIRGPERGASEAAADGVFRQLVDAWNTRATPPNMTRDEAEKLTERLEYAMHAWYENPSPRPVHLFDAVHKEREALLDALTAPRVPEGWVLVPRVPTAKMLKEMTYAGTDGSSTQGEARRMRDAYTAMLAAAPKVTT